MSKIKEWFQSIVDSGLTPQMPANIDVAIYEQYAKYLEAENEKLKQALDDIKVFGLEMKSGKIDMTIGSETFNYVTSMLVQVLAQNNAQNFLTTSIEISNQKYSVTAQKCNGKTPAEEIATLKAENEDLTVKNEVLQRDVENLTRTLEEGGEEYRALQSENAQLRARLEKAVELPCKVGDTIFYVQYFCDYKGCNSITQQFCCGCKEMIEREKHKETYVICEKSFALKDFEKIGKKYFTTREAAEFRLAEQEGGER